MVPELLEVYPNAKVVLIERDPRKWWVSFHGNLKYAGAWFLPVLTFVGPGLRWFPKLMIAWKREADVLMESIGKRPGDFGPGE